MIGWNDIKSRLRGWSLEGLRRIQLHWALRNIERTNPILVYQMGKVGSSSVVRTLEHLRLGRPVLHVHTLDADHVKRAIRKQRASVSPYLPEHLIASSLLVDRLAEGDFPCQIVTLTREPVGRAISFVFEDWKKKALQAQRADGRLDIDAMADAVTNLLHEHAGHADPGQWFERELHAGLGVDVFSVPYDRDRGFTVVREGAVTALVMRMEDLDRALVPGLATLLDVDPSHITVQRANTGGQKWYAEALRTVKDSYRLPADLAGEIFETRYMRHFYSQEADRLRQRWTRGPEVSNS